MRVPPALAGVLLLLLALVLAAGCTRKEESEETPSPGAPRLAPNSNKIPPGAQTGAPDDIPGAKAKGYRGGKGRP